MLPPAPGTQRARHCTLRTQVCSPTDSRHLRRAQQGTTTISAQHHVSRQHFPSQPSQGALRLQLCPLSCAGTRTWSGACSHRTAVPGAVFSPHFCRGFIYWKILLTKNKHIVQAKLAALTTLTRATSSLHYVLAPGLHSAPYILGQIKISCIFHIHLIT